MLAVSKVGARVFRNNVGVAVFDDGRRVRYGLCPGSSDLIGWLPVTITADMVGQRVAVFVAIEAKAAKGVARENQETFIAAVVAAGGVAGIARSDAQALALVNRRT